MFYCFPSRHSRMGREREREMASGGGIKGFYWQRKKIPTSQGRRQALHHEKQGPEEAALRQLDMDMSYGPCLGMTHPERATCLGFHPPPELEGLLLRHQGVDGSGAPLVNLDCLWEGRI